MSPMSVLKILRRSDIVGIHNIIQRETKILEEF